MFSISLHDALPILGFALTAPISSAAIAIMLGLDGLAAGAATVGCSAQMVEFAVSSFKENGVGGLLAQGLGTSMLQIANIIKNPMRSEEHTSELQSRGHLVCRLLLE